MKNIYEIEHVHTPTDEKDVVDDKYCDKNLLSSSNKIDILSTNITELGKGEFDKVTTTTVQLDKRQVNFKRKLLVALSLYLNNIK